jgi:hypothetical protein
MTLQEALAELGLGSATSADEAQRAYLRLVKQRRPDHDPAGFKRARAAFELVRDWIASGAGAAPGVAAEGDAAGAIASGGAGPAPARSPETEAAARAFREAAAIEEPSEYGKVVAALEEARAHPDVGMPPVLVAVETLLVLYVTGQPAQAAELLGAMTAWLATVPSEAQVFAGGLGPRWALARDLSRLAARLPTPTLAEVARALALGDSTRAILALRGFARRSPKEAKELSAELSASPFAEAYRHLEAPPPPLPSPAGDLPVPQAEKPAPRMRMLVLVAVLIALRILLALLRR